MLRILVFCVTLLLGSARAEADSLFSISSPQFSAGVATDGSYRLTSPAQDNRISRSSLVQGALYFSFTVVCTEKTIEYLKRKSRLEVVTWIFAVIFNFYMI